MDKELGKQLAAEHAAELVKKMAGKRKITLGLGTGSTVFYFINELGKLVSQGLKIKAISTSHASTKLARKKKIKVSEDYNQPGLKIDILVDGADEVHEKTFEMIKGGGGANTKEEMVANISKFKITIVDPSKLVKNLGKFPLPVEIMPSNINWIMERFKKDNYKPAIRKKAGGKLFITDFGNYIIDLHLGKIKNAVKAKYEIKKILGVISVGLFVENNCPDVVFVGEKKLVNKNKK